MTLQARTDALLALIEADRDAQCAAILAEARARAAALRSQAHGQARAQVHEALTQERARLATALAAARAELQTQRRLHGQRRVEALLALGWQRLPQVLRERWRAPATRQAWVAHAWTRARDLLPAQGGRAWQVSHGDDWPESERDAFAAQVARELGMPPQWRHDPRIAAGLRIAAGGNVVDATAAGLLADRDEVGGRLVGLLQEDS